MQPTPEQTTMASKQNWNIKHINNCNVGVLYYDAQTPKYGNGVLFHFPPIHRVHIGETTKSWDQLATQISTNLLRGRNGLDIRKTMKGIRGCLGLHTFRLLPYWTHLYICCIFLSQRHLT